MDTPDEPSAQQISQRWHEIAHVVEVVRSRLAGDGSGFDRAPDSSLARDDAESSPYQVSHVVRMCMTAGIDHLHAVTQLVVTDNTLHVAAPFSLVRAALETFSAAFWVLHPSARNERITRALRWHGKNFNDQHDVTSSIEGLAESDLAAMRQKLYAVAGRRGLRRELIGNGYVSTTAVSYADNHSGVDGVLFAWKLCSGFAHGRPWAYLGASERAQYATADPGVHLVQMSSTLGTTLVPTNTAAFLLQAVIHRYNLQSGALLSELELELGEVLDRV